MLKGAVAGRYAEALYEIASEQKVLPKYKSMVDRIEGELRAVNRLINESAELRRVLYHPQITAEVKKDLLKKIFKGKVADVTYKFLALLVDRRRAMYFAGIVEEYEKLANTGRNVVTAEVTSAVVLSDSEKASLLQVLSKLTGKKVVTSYNIDPSLVGGVVVRIGDRIIDGSIKTRLAAMRDHLKATS